jgi:putative ABC transport system substrate-binding protein
MTTRRDFITLLGGAAAAWPVAARAQQPERMRRIGVLTTFSADDTLAEGWLAAFRKGLEGSDWRDDRKVQIEYRRAAGDADRLAASAKELVALRPDVIFAVTTPTVAALLRETRTLPIVFAQVSDPVGSGFSLPSRGRAATSPGLRTSTSKHQSAANGCSFLSKSRPRSGVSP